MSIKNDAAKERLGALRPEAAPGADQMVTRSIRISKHDLAAIEAYFQAREQTFTQGVRLILKEWMRENGVM